MNPAELSFLGRYFICCEMLCQTGLHIGGSTSGVEISGIDNPVIKNSVDDNEPYVPGSTLKGRMRSLLEWTGQYHEHDGRKMSCVEYHIVQEVARTQGRGQRLPEQIQSSECRCGTCDVCIIFGAAAESAIHGPTRLTIRDSFATEETRRKWEAWLGKHVYTEVKMENAIDRITAEANPRPMERVPKGSAFCIRMVYDVYHESDERRLSEVFRGLHLVENATLGGDGSRGSGEVKFQNFGACFCGRDYYLGKPEVTPLPVEDLANYPTARQIAESAATIFCFARGCKDK